MLHRRTSLPRLVTAVLLSLLVLPLSGRPGFAAAGPNLLEWARRLVAGVTPETNIYASRPTIVTWTGVSGASETRNRSVCSALVAHLMMQAYGYRPADFASWLGGRFPRAAGFHDAIAAGRGFDPVLRIAEIRPGDVLAIKYPPGSHPTGHVLLAASQPVERRATEPIVPGTVQYELSVIDSSHTGHGPTDSRHYAKGKFHSGVGEGLFRLYAGPDGALTGYSWSVTKASEVYTPGERHLVIGHLNGQVKPTGHPGHVDAETGDESADDDAGAPEN
ncbi:MAG TPA: hypothetical protein VGS07_33300 [Thermoanaerobaculia bacterium]|jgi:hypothetical protein|nr:hypothetical protein [Thermoanaerobaculia bacterium]